MCRSTMPTARCVLRFCRTTRIEFTKEQPRRAEDLHLTEAVGHFHFYAWLKEVVLGKLSGKQMLEGGGVQVVATHGDPDHLTA